MKQALFNNWIAALRSGKYGQCPEYLGVDNDRCCLGVLLDVANIPSKRRDDDGVMIYEHDGQSDESLLPANFADEVRMSTGGEVMDGSTAKSLSNMNDHGTSFAEIADLLEANPTRYIQWIEPQS